jgi:hypothetical protein
MSAVNLVVDGTLTASGTTNFITDGSAGAVTQITSPTTAVTLNKRVGLITMQAACAAAGSAFTFNNSYITASSKVIALVANTRCLVSFGVVTVVVSAVAAGSCTITVAGDGTNASAAAPIVQFLVI